MLLLRVDVDFMATKLRVLGDNFYVTQKVPSNRCTSCTLIIIIFQRLYKELSPPLRSRRVQIGKLAQLKSVALLR